MLQYSASVFPFKKWSYIQVFSPFAVYFCIWCQRMLLHSFMCSCPVFPAYLLKRLSFLHCIFLPPLLQIKCKGMDLPLGSPPCSIHLPVCFLCQYSLLYLCSNLCYSLKSGSVIPPASLFFLKIVLAIKGLLCFHTNLLIICSSFVKNAISILQGIALNLQIALGNMVI